MLPDLLAFDRATIRTTDPDSGHLHVTLTPISKANICPYNGGEIPGFEKLGLDATRSYRLFRDPAELEKAAATFNGKPLLMIHKLAHAADHPHEMVVGSVGGDVTFDAPFLKASLSVWDGGAIDRINDDSQREISCGYYYDADMTPGTYEGQAYDGVMRNIRGNHVTLVSEGRAGPDVLVGDEAHKPILSTTEIAPMAKLSHKAQAAVSVLRAVSRSILATDARAPDFRAALADVPVKNGKLDRTKLKAALDGALKGKLAADADLEELVERIEESVADVVDDVQDAKAAAAAEGGEPDTTEDADENTADKVRGILVAASVDDATINAVLDAIKDEDEPQPPAPGAADRVQPVGVTKAALDTAVAAARKDAETSTIARLRAIQAAEREVKPFIGEVAAMDSAPAIYKLALDHLGVDLTGVPDSAYGAVLRTQPRPDHRAPAPRIAADSKPLADRRTAMFGPNANRLSAH